MVGGSTHSWAAGLLVAEAQLVEGLPEKERDEIHYVVVSCPLVVRFFGQTLSSLAVYHDRCAKIRWCRVVHN
jgi:hypothetical protein